MNRSILRMSILMIAAGVLASFGFDAKGGDCWVSGGFSFQSSGVKYKNDFLNDFYNDDDRYNTIQFSPSFRFFPVNHFCIGPEFNWIGVFTDGSGANVFELKGTLGLVGVAGNSYPYLLAAPGAQFAESVSRFVLPFSGGIMLAISEHLGLSSNSA